MSSTLRTCTATTARAGCPARRCPRASSSRARVTHLCAPAFVRWRARPRAVGGEAEGPARAARFIVTRGLFIAALDPLWMSLGFSGYRPLIFQVLYAIGLSMVCMAALRRLPTTLLVAGALAIQVLRAVLALATGGAAVARDLVPAVRRRSGGEGPGATRWAASPGPPPRVRSSSSAGRCSRLLGGRGFDGYGNWGLPPPLHEFPPVVARREVPAEPRVTSPKLGIALPPPPSRPARRPFSLLLSSSSWRPMRIRAIDWVRGLGHDAHDRRPRRQCLRRCAMHGDHGAAAGPRRASPRPTPPLSVRPGVVPPAASSRPPPRGARARIVMR